MKTKRWVEGLNNSQKIRVICAGVGFHTTVAGAFDMVFTSQLAAVSSVLARLGAQQHFPEDKRPSGLTSREQVLNEHNEMVEIDVQVDLC